MVIEMLAGNMRLDRISPEAIGRAAKRAGCGIVAVEDDMRQTYTVKHIRKGLVRANISCISCISWLDNKQN